MDRERERKRDREKKRWIEIKRTELKDIFEYRIIERDRGRETEREERKRKRGEENCEKYKERGKQILKKRSITIIQWEKKRR